MAYSTLKKVYFADRSHYEEEYLNRFNNLSAVHVDFEIGKNPAFFLPIEEMLSLDYSIQTNDRAVRRIRAKLPSAAADQYFIKSLIDEVYLTLDIEQVVSTRKEIAQIHRGKNDGRLSGMVHKYATMMKGTQIPMETCADIRALYDEICLPEVVSENENNRPDGQMFRLGENQVVGKSEKLLHEGLHPEPKIIAAMSQALNFLNHSKISLSIRVAAFHYLLGYIHPFYDGNGRLARFISSYSLSQEMDPLICVRLSYSIKENRTSYYKLFKETNDPKNKGDLTYFIIGFLKILDSAYQNLHEALREKADQLAAYAAILDSLQLQDKRLGELAYLLLQVRLFRPAGMRFDEILENTQIAQRPLRQFLTSEETRGMFTLKKEGRANAYALNLEWLNSQDKLANRDE